MFRYARLLALFFRISIQNDAAYRTDFILRSITSVLQLLGELIGLFTIFSNTRSLAGWTVYQVLVLLGVFHFMTGLIGMFIAPNMRALMESIRSGTLDFILLKPVSSQFYVSFRGFVVWRVTDLILGAALALVGSAGLGHALTAANAVAFVLMLAAGAVIIYSVWLALATTVFWATRINNIEMVFWNTFEAARYPIDIYRPWVRWALTYLLPMAFLTTFPAAALLGKLSFSALLAGLAAAPMMLAAATLFWRYGVRSYRGASA